MTGENFGLNILDTLQSMPKIGISGIIEIVIISIAVYKIVKLLKNTRAWVITKAVLMILLIYTAALLVGFNVVVSLFQSSVIFIGVGVVVILQPELRKMLEKLGSSGIDFQISKLAHIFRNFNKEVALQKNISDESITEIVKGCCAMSKVKTGVLIVIENNTPLDEFIETGIPVDAKITSQLLINIFEKNTPLHDGAVIIKKDRVESATCYLPLTDNHKIDKSLGTRHRAAIGISEITDSIVVVVSEETGGISVAFRGKLKSNLTRERLTEELKKNQAKYTQRLDKKIKEKNKPDVKIMVGSLIGTVLLWILMMESIDPITYTTIRDVPIQLLNQEITVESDKVYEINDSMYVNVTLKGRKSDLDSIEKSNILTVTADFKDLNMFNSLPLNCSLPGYSDVTYKLSSNSIEINIEDYMTAEFDIQIETEGTVDESKYLASLNAHTRTIVISGAESTINTIGSVVVSPNIQGIDENTTLYVEPIIYDKNGNIIDKSKLSLGVGEIPIDIELYDTKEVRLQLSYKMDDFIYGPIVTGVDCDTKTIFIAGEQEELDKYTSISIEIPLDINPLDISNNQYSKYVSISNMMPDNIYVCDQSGRIAITVEFTDFYAGALALNVSDITPINVESEDYIVELIGDSKQLVIVDPASTNFSLDNLNTVVDLAGLGVGEHTLDITFENLPETASIYGDISIKVVVSSKENT